MKANVKILLISILLCLSSLAWAGGAPEPTQEDEVYIYISNAIDESNWIYPESPLIHPDMNMRLEYSYIYEGIERDDSYSFGLGSEGNLVLQLEEPQMVIFFENLVINDSITIPLNFTMEVPAKESDYPYIHFPWQIRVRSASRDNYQCNYRMDFIPWSVKAQREYAREVCSAYPYFFGESPDWMFQVNPLGDQVESFSHSFQLDWDVEETEEVLSQDDGIDLFKSKYNN